MGYGIKVMKEGKKERKKELKLIETLNFKEKNPIG